MMLDQIPVFIMYNTGIFVRGGPFRPGSHCVLHVQQAPPYSTLKGVFVDIWMGHGALKPTARPPMVRGGLMGSVAAQSRPRLAEGACALGFIPIGVLRGVLKWHREGPKGR
jgi:hypothetical protein